MTERSTGRESDKFMLRLPDGMRDRLKKLAAENGRSLNAEIIHRLEDALSTTENSERIDRLYQNEMRLIGLIQDLGKSQKTLERQAQQLAELAEKYALERDEEHQHRLRLEQQISSLVDLTRASEAPPSADLPNKGGGGGAAGRTARLLNRPIKPK